MRALFLLPALWLFLAIPGFSQIVIEEESEEVEIDLAQMEGPGKSKALAVILSASLPGLGERYLEQPKRASTHFFAEAALWAGLAASSIYAVRHFENAESYAYIHAGSIAGVADKDGTYYENIADFQDVWEYNAVNELNRDYDKLYQNENMTWRWESDESQETYSEILMKYRTAKMVKTFMIGGLAFHRFFSMIDAVRIARTQSILQTSPYQLHTDGERLLVTLRF